MSPNLSRLIEKIQPEYPIIANLLNDLVYNFRFDTIMTEITQSSKDLKETGKLKASASQKPSLVSDTTNSVDTITSQNL